MVSAREFDLPQLKEAEMNREMLEDQSGGNGFETNVVVTAEECGSADRSLQGSLESVDS